MGVNWVRLLDFFVLALLTVPRSHIVMIACVLVFSAYFFFANKRQRAGKTVIEGTVRKVFGDEADIEANLVIGWFPTYILRIDGERLDERGMIQSTLNATKTTLKKCSEVKMQCVVRVVIDPMK